MKRSPILISLIAAAFTALIALTSLHTYSQAAWGKTKEEMRTVLLWNPEMESIDWMALQKLLRAHPDAGLTIALSPEMIPEEVRPWLAAWVKEGRLEIALRIAGDPILPLIQKQRGRDVIERIALARMEYKQIFDRFPDGFVAGDGALTPALAQTLERQKFKWSAVGDSAFRTPWYTESEKPMVIFPFHVPESTAPAYLANLKEIYTVVLDESYGRVSGGYGIEILTGLFQETPNDRWTSASAALEHINPYAVGPAHWPLWSGPLDAWTAHPLQDKAWRLYSLAVGAMKSYQNSGAASLSVLNRANTHIYRAQNSQYYTVKNLKTRAMEHAFRSHLSRVFKTINRQPPRVLSSPIKSPIPIDSAELTDIEAPLAEPEEKEENATQEGGAVREVLEANSLSFENPEDSLAALPTRMPELPEGSTAQHLWTPHALNVTWDEASVTLTMSVQRLYADEKAPNGYAALMLELYVDLNNLSGRGATALLPQRKGFVHSADAWEYAIIATGWDVGLYRAVPGQPPALVQKLNSTTDMEKGAVTVTVPRNRLRGNPARWGYILLTLATDSLSAQSIPPRPLEGENGSPLLGLLGSLEAQKKLANSKSTYRRINALRIKEEPTADR